MDRPRGTLCQAAREIQTDGAAARYLIDFRKLLDAFAACSDAQAMCEFLVVDADLVYARILLLDKLDRVTYRFALSVALEWTCRRLTLEGSWWHKEPGRASRVWPASAGPRMQGLNSWT